MPSSSNNLKKELSLALLNRGYLLSKQREVIIDAICREKEIKDIELFWMDLRREHAISWATMYKSVSIFIKHGWIVKEGKSVNGSVYRLAFKVKD